MKIEFYKNNNKVEIEEDSIKYLAYEKKIIRLTDQYEIILDFKNRSCSMTLLKENITFDIKVLEMSFLTYENKEIFSFTLETESEIKNTIICYI